MEKFRAYLDGERGRASRLAAIIKVSPSAISMWEQVPAERVADVAAATGIPPEDLRPDLAALFSTSQQERVAS